MTSMPFWTQCEKYDDMGRALNYMLEIAEKNGRAHSKRNEGCMMEQFTAYLVWAPCRVVLVYWFCKEVLLALRLLVTAFGSSSLFFWVLFLLRRYSINVPTENKVTADSMPMIIVQ